MMKQFSPSLRLAATALACAAAFASFYAQASNYYAVLPLAGVDAAQSSRPVRIALAGATPPPAYVGVPYSFNLGALVSLEGPEGTDPANITWSVFSGALPAGLALVGDTISGTPTGVSEPIAVKLRAEYAQGFQSVGAMQGYTFEVPAIGIRDFGVYRAWGDGTFAQSCDGYRSPADGAHGYEGATGDGVYRISPSGTPFDAYCDQTSDGGGWTRVVLQYESNPVAWTGAQSGLSYTLSQAQIPAHTFTGFGKDGIATLVDYVPFQYATGNINPTTVTSPKTGITYQVFRNSGCYFFGHDPESGLCLAGTWNTLSLDEVGVRYSYSWAFAAGDGTLPPYMQGYGMAGVDYQTTNETFGWSVWVK